MRKTRPVEERFWEKVDKTPICWNWIGTMRGHAASYGSIIIEMDGQRRVQRYAHRVSYEMAYGPIPKGLQICHKCDNPKCVRPGHLFAGTARDNQMDCLIKNRGNKETTTKEFTLMTPSGDIINGRNLNRFCREYALHYNSINSVILRKRDSYRGYRRAE